MTHDQPGVTRDRREGEGRIGPLSFRVIDTAGLDEGDPESLAGRMMRQTERAIKDADVSLFVIDGRADPVDLALADDVAAYPAHALRPVGEQVDD